ncbi:MAG: 3-oxoadipate enol-lactonase, partial [Ilumatobacteraceae bacterium]|nr:3-oxoadipate enol-lactonase [Ilumatobacteraceae bacterium]
MTSFATTTSGTRIAFEVAGRPWRPPLILTHSLGSDHRMWESQVQALESQYFIVAIDNVGHGESDSPEGDYSVGDLGDAVLAVADAAELDRFHYCGLSVGGITGQWLATRHPHRLISLTLSNTAARIGTAELWNERIRVARTEGMAALADSV